MDATHTLERQRTVCSQRKVFYTKAGGALEKKCVYVMSMFSPFLSFSLPQFVQWKKGRNGKKMEQWGQ